MMEGCALLSVNGNPVDDAAHAMEMLNYQINDRDSIQPTFEVVVRERKGATRPVVQSL